jgi:hypothetical protein
MRLSIRFIAETDYENHLSVKDADYIPNIGEAINDRGNTMIRFIVTSKDIFIESGKEAHIIITATQKQ